MGILLFILILGLLVFVHEFGHFYAARRSGVGVEEFGFGFPPRLWGIQRGPTTYSVNLIPFGGFVRLQGEQADHDARTDSFVNAPPLRQYVIIAAGVLMNALLAWVLMTSALVVGLAADQATIPADRFARFQPTRQEAVVSAGGSVARAGLTSGDDLLSINQQVFRSTDHLIAYTKDHDYPALEIRYRRQGREYAATIRPDPAGDHPRYGFGIVTIGRLSYPWYVAPWYGLSMTGRLTGQTVVGLGQVVVNLVRTGQVSTDVTGPVGIAVLTSQVSQLGVVAIIQFMAILSISLAVINFLPIPALDGGRALFIVLSRLRGRPIDRRVENLVHAAGFYLLIVMVILISIRDVQRFELLDRLTQWWK